MSVKLNDKRLLAAATLGRSGKRFADIGTDHAYLPIYLIQSGRSPEGLATDVRDGPVASAVRNISASGLEDKITVAKRDGLDLIVGFAPDDIYILGMGGELIRDIISASDYVKRHGVRLILQPMTRQEILRTYLYKSGFQAVDETLVRSQGRIYQLTAVEYTGVCEELSDVEALLGKINIERGGDLLREYAARLARQRRRAADGASKAGNGADDLYRIARELEIIAGISASAIDN